MASRRKHFRNRALWSVFFSATADGTAALGRCESPFGRGPCRTLGYRHRIPQPIGLCAHRFPIHVREIAMSADTIATAVQAEHSGPMTATAARRKSPLPRLPLRTILLAVGGIGVVSVGLWIGVPWVERALNTVSTDDAYVSDYVTFVAARVPGQVVRVLVEDNNRVHKGDVLVELDREPYQVQVDIADAAVAAAKADLVAATAATRGIAGKARSLRFNLATRHRTGRQPDRLVAGQRGDARVPKSLARAGAS